MTWLGSLLERECTNKRRYSSVQEAEQEARIIFNEGGRQLHTYECLWCHGIHLTGKDREGDSL